eukprot:647500-Hanusia_phi.AAC.3
MDQPDTCTKSADGLSMAKYCKSAPHSESRSFSVISFPVQLEERSKMGAVQRHYNRRKPSVPCEWRSSDESCDALRQHEEGTASAAMTVTNCQLRGELLMVLMV